MNIKLLPEKRKPVSNYYHFKFYLLVTYQTIFFNMKIIEKLQDI